MGFGVRAGRGWRVVGRLRDVSFLFRENGNDETAKRDEEIGEATTEHPCRDQFFQRDRSFSIPQNISASRLPCGEIPNVEVKEPKKAKISKQVARPSTLHEI